MWTPADRALVGDFGSGQALTDDQFRLLEPLIPPAKPGGRPRTTDVRELLDGLFYLVRTGCQWRHLPPPPAFPPWRTVYGYMRAFDSVHGDGGNSAWTGGGHRTDALRWICESHQQAPRIR
jgi:putative transposase